MSELEAFVTAYRTVEQAGYSWEEMDRVILALCEKTPGHRSQREVMARVALVNRAYRAHLQMGDKDAEWTLAGRLVESEIDEQIEELRGIPTFNATTAPLVVAAHGALVALCKEATGRWALSFASKYLSFHAPMVVPLFDQKAHVEGKKLVQGLVNAPISGCAAMDYRWHAARVLYLAEHLQEHGIDPNLKIIDIVLYGSAGGRG